MMHALFFCQPVVRASFGILSAAMLVSAAAFVSGCSESPRKPAPESRPVVVTTQAEPVVEPPATKPAEPKQKPAPKPESQAADELPPSRYNPDPPYAVELHVRSPMDKQPGWIRIVQLEDGKKPAAATGSFPEQNQIHIQTDNVKQIEINIGHLPLAPRKRLSLQIDKLGMELLRGKRRYVTLERRPTGAWEVVDSRE